MPSTESFPPLPIPEFGEIVTQDEPDSRNINRGQVLPYSVTGMSPTAV